jgi:hypothetical protein
MEGSTLRMLDSKELARLYGPGPPGWGLGVELRPHPGKSQQLGNLRCGLGTVRSIDKDDWEKSKEAKVRIGL